MFRARKVQPGDVREYAGYLTDRVKAEAGYAASGASRVVQGDYYLGTPGEPDADPLGVWMGKGAERLGLVGAVDREQLERLWEGRDPATGEPVIRPGANGEHVPAIDMVVSVPKSVSLAWAMEQDPTRRALIEGALTHATEAVMAVMERDCPLVARRVGGRIVREPAAGLVMSRFRHHTARTTDAQAERGDGADPDLHDHVLLANYAVRRDGNVGAIDSLGAMRVQQLLTQLHYAQAERELQRIGFDTVRVGDHFELAGASQEGINEFSSRSQVIDEAVAEFRAKYGRHPTPAEHQELVRETRRGKDTHPAGDRERWRMREEALDHRTLPPATEGAVAVPATGMAAINERARLRYERGEAGLALRSTEELAAGVLEELTTGTRRLSRDSAVFDTQELHLAAAKALVGRDGADIVEQYQPVLDAVKASPEIVMLDREHWTTRRHLEMEQRVVALARTRAAGSAGPSLLPRPDPARVEWHIAHAPVPLDAEQQAAVWAACGDRGYSQTIAEAGTGKGAVARAIADVYRELGYRVIAVSTAAQRAQDFGRDVGADEATSIDGLVHSCARGFGLGPRTIVLVDEVGQADTYRMENLLGATEQAQLRAFGDTEQLDSVEAGGMLRVLERELGAASLSTVYRTRDEELIALWRKVRAGDAAAIEELDRRGALVFIETLAEARENAVQTWDAERVQGEQHEGGMMRRHLLVTNISNHQVDRLNALAQQGRLERGEIGGPFADGIFEDAPKSYRRVERFYAGDHVRLVSGAKLDDEMGRRTHVRNGQAGRVVSIAEDGTAVVEIDGRRDEERGRFATREESARSRFAQAAHARRDGLEREQQEKRGRYLSRGIDPSTIDGWEQEARERFEGREAQGRAEFEARWAGRRAEFLAAGEGATVRVGEQEMALLRLGYAGHDQTTQGRTSQTIDAVIGRQATDRQSAYVELSRARQDARFHVAMDQWGVPSERVVEPATAERKAVVESIPREERVVMAKEMLVETFGRSRPEVAALEFQARALDELIRGEAARVDRERQAVGREAARPATPRQFACARALGAEIPAGATWVEASTAIERITGAEPGTFAREALAARHDLERVDELLAEVEARQAAIPPSPADVVDTVGWRDVARIHEEPATAATESRCDKPRAGPTDHAGDVPGLLAPQDRSVSAPFTPDEPSASLVEAEHASLDIAKPVPGVVDEASEAPTEELPGEAATRQTIAELQAAEAGTVVEDVGHSSDPREEPGGEPDVALAASSSPPVEALIPSPPLFPADEVPQGALVHRSGAEEIAPMLAPAADQEGKDLVREAELTSAEPAAEEAAIELEDPDEMVAGERERAAQRESAEREAAIDTDLQDQEAELTSAGPAAEQELEVGQEEERQAEREPEPAAEPLGHEWAYDLWAEPTADQDDYRQAGRGMGMEM